MPARAPVLAVLAAAALAACGGDEPTPTPRVPVTTTPRVSSELACRIAPDALVARALRAREPLSDGPDGPEGTIRSSCTWFTGAPGAVRERLLLTVSAVKDFASLRRERPRARDLDGIGDAAFVSGSGPTLEAGFAAARAGGRVVAIFLNDNRGERRATSGERRALVALLRATVVRLPR